MNSGNRLKRLLALLCLFIIVFAASLHEPKQQERSSTFFAMDTTMTIRFTGGSDKLLQAAENEVNALEQLISVTLDSSEVFQLNRDGECRISYETALLLGRALALCEETGGTLDISVYPLVKEWGFTTGNYHVPSEETISSLLEHVDYRKLAMDSDIVTLPEGMAIDFGSVAKGFAGDRICSLLKEDGITSAILELGGNIQALGSKPDGSLWRVAVQSPGGEGYAGIVSVSNAAVITSGGYQRCFEDENGHVWWHIINPDTGYPADNGLLSVTIVGEDGTRCDALSTALFVMGEENAICFWREHKDFDMILITDDGRLLITPSLYSSFERSRDHDYTLETISAE